MPREMDSKPLFPDAPPHRYPVVWQSRAARFTNPSTHHHRHHSPPSRHHHPQPAPASHRQQQPSNKPCANNTNNHNNSKHHQPTPGSVLFSPNLHSIHANSRRPFLPPPAVAPKPSNNSATAGASNISAYPLHDAELSCSSSPTAESSSFDDSTPFVRLAAAAAHAAHHRPNKMTRSYEAPISQPAPQPHHSSRHHHRQTSPHHVYGPSRCPIGLCQIKHSPSQGGPTQFDPSRYSNSYENFAEYPLLHPYHHLHAPPPTAHPHQHHHHPFSFYSTPELQSAGRSPYFSSHHHLPSSTTAAAALHGHHHHNSAYHQYQPAPFFVPYSRSHLHHGNHGPSSTNPVKKFDNPYAAMRFYNESAAKYRSSILQRARHRRRCRGHLIVLSIILAVITVGVIMGVILAMTIN